MKRSYPIKQEEIIRLRGFQVETHYAITKDGHHLHLARIVNPKIPKPKKRPVLFNHGLFESSTIWLINSRDFKPSNYTEERKQLPKMTDMDPNQPRNNLAFTLANTGYDVWLLSMRGTEFSLKHDKYNHANDHRFWRYSLDHFALLDIPAAIDFVMKTTKYDNKTIGYVGHSQAGYAILALLANKPKYRKLLRPVVAFAPVTHFRHMTSAARLLMKGVGMFSNALNKDGPFPRDAIKWRQLNKGMCGDKLMLSLPCQFVNSLIAGSGDRWLSGFYTHLPYQTSLMVLRHFAQQLRRGNFERYDYGPAKNRRFYRKTSNSTEVPDVLPPPHPIERINHKWLLIVAGETDKLSTPKDIEVIDQSVKVKPRKIIMVQGANHFDIMLSDKYGKQINEPVLELLELAEKCDKGSKNGTAGPRRGGSGSSSSIRASDQC